MATLMRLTNGWIDADDIVYYSQVDADSGYPLQCTVYLRGGHIANLTGDDAARVRDYFLRRENA